jgi:hypothetical protein
MFLEVLLIELPRSAAVESRSPREPEERGEKGQARKGFVSDGKGSQGGWWKVGGVAK